MFDTMEQPDIETWLAGDDVALDPGGLELEELFAHECEIIPMALDSMAPGPALAAILSSVDAGRLNGYDRVVVLRARQRMASHYAAGVLSDMAAVAEVVEADWDQDPESAAHAAAAEIRAALHLTRRTADSELALAIDLENRLPQVWQALAAGNIDQRRARVIAESTVHLDDDLGSDIVDRVLDEASELTTGELAARLRRMSIEVAPDEAKQRFEKAVDRRRVVSQPTEDGTSHLFGLDLPPDRVAGATNYINRLAKRLSGRDSRTIDQIRADVMLDLLNGVSVRGASGRNRGTVDITVDLTTLAQLDDNPAKLAGYGPVIADIGRQVARDQADATWTFAVRDPGSGRVLHTGVTRRRPTAAVERQVVARYPRCVFPGCRMPARQSDLDHRKLWSQGGRTSRDNLCPLCRFDHGIRHAAGWNYDIGPDGEIIWRSRLGHTYRTGTDPP